MLKALFYEIATKIGLALIAIKAVPLLLPCKDILLAVGRGNFMLLSN
jgi:hypothetical protein